MNGPVPSAALGDLTAAPGVAVTAAVAQPSPAPTGGLEAYEVTPGLLGFVPVFLIAVACVGLFLSLTRHMRRVTVRQALLDAEEQGRGSGEVGPSDPDGDTGAGDGPRSR